MKLELRGESIALRKMRLQFLLDSSIQENYPQITRITPIRETRLAMFCEPQCPVYVRGLR